MKVVITGYSKIISTSADSVFMHVKSRIIKVRPVHALDTLIISAIGELLDCAGVTYPVKNDNIGLFIGIDDSIEEIKNEYFSNIVKDGMMGVSPLLFPFTSPNALAAQVSIAFDLRGECITLPVKNSLKNVIDYGSECIVHKYSKAAIAGSILKNKVEQFPDKAFTAEFLFLEQTESAVIRKHPFIPLTEDIKIDESIWKN